MIPVVVTRQYLEIIAEPIAKLKPSRPNFPDPVNIRIASEGSSSIDAYASVSIAFEVTSVFDSAHLATGDARRLVKRLVEHPYIKDYDKISGDSPLDWPGRFDVSQWQFLAAYAGEQRAGGAVVIMNAPDVGMLEGRDDLALLWDLRVAPPFRSGGVGSALMHAAEALAASRGARVIKVETQSINVRACRFYASHGFDLRQANAEVYEALPHEVQLLWYKPLDKTA